ncbi:hypothetical protein [Paenibacillus qinlingensis]|uniref:RNA polymerase sigma-70 region 4 domain-containing protein n=1 Tax=Paenibacillus qinlingensis TaxID=1837343 RepID=A0ABU1NRP8_9BACL|nr:hypothetical protein [Paenibacillus qinlingensis]MDR6550024.1 hypothetical protein [Paenibacillus qinlingensis]
MTKRQDAKKLHGNCKITDEQVREIYARGHKGESQTALGKEFGVTQGHVGYILKRHTRLKALLGGSEQ